MIGLLPCPQHQFCYSSDGDASSAPFIPGLDLSPDKSASVTSQSNSNVDGKFVRRKAIYTKPVPKDFERAWVEGRQPSIVSNRDIPEENSETHEGPGELKFKFRFYSDFIVMKNKK